MRDADPRRSSPRFPSVRPGRLAVAALLAAFAAPTWLAARSAQASEPPADPPADPDDAAAAAPPVAADPNAATAAEPAPSEAPPVAADPDAPPTPEGPAPEQGEYASSQGAGQGMSGKATPTAEGPADVEVVGEQKKTPKNLSHSSTGQLGAAAGIGYGLVTAGDKYCGQFTDDPSDQDARKSLCTGATPAVLDITLGFGANARIDIVVGMRLNLQKRDYDNGPCSGGDATCVEGRGLFVDKRGIGVLPGVRLWGKDNDKVFKVGGAVDILYMFENFEGYRNRLQLDDTNNDVHEDDDMIDEKNRNDESKVGNHILGLRGGPILQVDPHHNIGIFLIPAAVPTFRPQQGNATESGWFEIAFEATLGVQARFP